MTTSTTGWLEVRYQVSETPYRMPYFIAIRHIGQLEKTVKDTALLFTHIIVSRMFVPLSHSDSRERESLCRLIANLPREAFMPSIMYTQPTGETLDSARLKVLLDEINKAAFEDSPSTELVGE